MTLRNFTRKYVPRVAAAVAVMLIGIPAVAGAKTRHTGKPTHRSKQDVVVVSRHRTKRVLFIQRHVRGNTTAREASCLAGLLTPPYCTPPVEDTLFGAFSQGATTFGSNSKQTCRALGYSSAPCGVYTNVPNELIVAFVSADGPQSGGQGLTVTCSTPSGGACPVTFHRVAGENLGLGDAEVWYADATNIIPKTAPIFVTATPAEGCGGQLRNPCDVSLNVVTFKNAITAGAGGVQGTGIGNSSVSYSMKGAPTGTLTTTEPDSWVWGAMNDWGGAHFRVVPSGQNAQVQILDLTNQKSFWIQSTSSYTPASGTPVTINDTMPTADPFNEVLVEIL